MKNPASLAALSTPRRTVSAAGGVSPAGAAAAASPLRAGGALAAGRPASAGEPAACGAGVGTPAPAQAASARAQAIKQPAVRAKLILPWSTSKRSLYWTRSAVAALTVLHPAPGHPRMSDNTPRGHESAGNFIVRDRRYARECGATRLKSGGSRLTTHARRITRKPPRARPRRASTAGLPRACDGRRER